MASVRTGILVVLEGWGEGGRSLGNALSYAKTPVLDSLRDQYPVSTLEASGLAVGLPAGAEGTAEAGYATLAAGQPVAQAISRIDQAIEDGSFFENETFLGVAKKLQDQQRGTLHLVGLLSEGRIHSDLSHILALLQFAKREKIRHVALHPILDGRDSGPTEGLQFLATVRAFCDDVGVGRVESLMGRFYGMDRDLRWERTRLAYEAIVAGKANFQFTEAKKYLGECYDQRLSDEFVMPGIRKAYPGIKDGDAVIFFNFRPDRAIQLVAAMSRSEFPHFRRANLPALCQFITMTPYGEGLSPTAAFDFPELKTGLGRIVSSSGGAQLRIAEAEAFDRVTHLFNGVSTPFKNENRVRVEGGNSVLCWDQCPEMNAQSVTQRLIQELDKKPYQLAVVGFPNVDLVAHSGNFPATIKAAERVDPCLEKIQLWVESRDAFAIITANHGGAEVMLDAKGVYNIGHSTSRVPCIIVDRKLRRQTAREVGTLSDVAPTLLELWGHSSLQGMTGRSLLRS